MQKSVGCTLERNNRLIKTAIALGLGTTLVRFYTELGNPRAPIVLRYGAQCTIGRTLGHLPAPVTPLGTQPRQTFLLSFTFLCFSAFLRATRQVRL